MAEASKKYRNLSSVINIFVRFRAADFLSLHDFWGLFLILPIFAEKLQCWPKDVSSLQAKAMALFTRKASLLDHNVGGMWLFTVAGPMVVLTKV